MSESNGKALTRADIFSKPPEFARERVEVPQWGGHVYVKQITARAIETWQDWLVEQEKSDGLKHSFRVKLIMLCVCDEEGRLIFTDAADLAVLTDRENSVVELLWQACRSVNRMDKEATEKAAKN